MNCIFVSDLHGSIKKINNLFRIIEEENPDGVFVGGDIFPHASTMDINDFFNRFYLNKIKKIKKINNNTKFYFILGNDDPKIFEKLLIDAENKKLLYYVNKKLIKFNDLFVIGYSFIPPTPFVIKDWERYDVSQFVDPGCISPEEGKRSIKIDLEEEKFKTISNDLKEISKKSDPKKTIYLFHAPPYKTNLDRADLDDKIIDHVKLDVNIGSIAIKRFIKKYHPFLTLHGHVHESSRITGKWSEKIGETYSFSAAYEGDNLAIIYFDTKNLSKAKRRII